MLKNITPEKLRKYLGVLILVLMVVDCLIILSYFGISHNSREIYLGNAIIGSGLAVAVALLIPTYVSLVKDEADQNDS